MKFKSIKLYEEGGQRVSRMIEQSIADLASGDIVIQSQYAAVNYKDARAVTGIGKVLSNLPAVPGVEVAGLVVESSNPQFKLGDVVTVQGGREFGMRRDGAYSEYVRVPGSWAAHVPEDTDPFESVAMGLAAYTSALAVDELLLRGVKPEHGPILVTGGTGGSGVVILRYPDSKTITIGAGLTGSESAASGGYKRATITDGTGNVSWS